MAADDQNWFGKVIGSVDRIRFAPGVNGKSAWMYIVLMCVAGYALSKISETGYIVDAICVSVILLFAFLITREVGKMRDYAIKNPHLALMEGADITAHLKFVAESKALPLGDQTPMISDPKTPLLTVSRSEEEE